MGKKKEKEKEQESNGEYGEIDIRACENGYVVEARKLGARTPLAKNHWEYIGGGPKREDNAGFEEFIFKNLPEVIEWIQENAAATGKQRQFLDALGSDEPTPYDPSIMVGGGKSWTGNSPVQPTYTTVSTQANKVEELANPAESFGTKFIDEMINKQLDKTL